MRNLGSAEAVDHQAGVRDSRQNTEEVYPELCAACSHEFGKNLWGCSQPKGHGPKLVDLASKGEAQVLPVVGIYRKMEECIFQVQGHSPVHGIDGVSYEGRSLHLESRFD